MEIIFISFLLMLLVNLLLLLYIYNESFKGHWGYAHKDDKRIFLVMIFLSFVPFINIGVLIYLILNLR